MSIDRAAIIVAANRLTPANNAASAWDPDVGGEATFGDIGLIGADDPDDAAPTHFVANTLLTNQMRQQVLSAFDNVPFYDVTLASDHGDVEPDELLAIAMAELNLRRKPELD